MSPDSTIERIVDAPHYEDLRRAMEAAYDSGDVIGRFTQLDWSIENIGLLMEVAREAGILPPEAQNGTRIQYSGGPRHGEYHEIPHPGERVKLIGQTPLGRVREGTYFPMRSDDGGLCLNDEGDAYEYEWVGWDTPLADDELF